MNMLAILLLVFFLLAMVLSQKSDLHLQYFISQNEVSMVIFSALKFNCLLLPYLLLIHKLKV